ncbi:MAG: GTP 3',8-cyclase MoaA [Desulfobacterales bacterium]|nr:GTP 3',8-cyclase MoaA [Desulfobacterales bacterium]
MNSLLLKDDYHRTINYLRVSITDRCNLRCIYCQPEKPFPQVSHHDILTYEEITKIIRIGVSLGIQKVRITGGEPFVRKGMIDFLKQLSEIEGINEVSITTNGVLLKHYIHELKQCKINRINISLDTLNPDTFKAISGKEYFNQVWEGIMLAHELDFFPIKLNMVALNDINSDEWAEFAQLTFAYPFHIRFIEYMPIGNTSLNKHAALTQDVMNRLSHLGKLTEIHDDSHVNGPAKRYRIHGAIGEIGFISPLSHHFCATCNRLRLTATGMLIPCLLSDRRINIMKVIRQGADDKALSELFVSAVRQKQPQHQLAYTSHLNFNEQMSDIGG